ncbi:hypothetical protein PspLS_01808 [Pyricularia sp. CBS 133598]|nr:hypothetical protein PspLS_01808 [Pyricularia sp. CBS 133598]
MLLPDPSTPHILSRASYRSGRGWGVGVAGGGGGGGGSKLSTGAIVGIVIGITALAVITLTFIGARRGWWTFRPRRRKDVDESDSVSTNDMINPMSEHRDAPDVAFKDWRRKFTWGRRGDGVVAESRAAQRGGLGGGDA